MNAATLQVVRMRTSSTILLAACAMRIATAQDLRIGAPMEPAAGQKAHLSEKFSSVSVVDLDTRALHALVRDNKRINTVELRIDASRALDLELEQNEMRPHYYLAEETGPNGRVQVPRTPCITYKGRLAGKPESVVRLNIEADRVWGYVMDNGTMTFVEPLRELVPGGASERLHMVYRQSDLKARSIGSCGASTLAEQLPDEVVRSEPTGMERSGNDCRKLEVATESDWEFYADGKTFSDIQGNLNMVEGIYYSQFNMRFLIVYQHQWTTSSDPYNATITGCGTPITGQLDEFNSHWAANFGHIRRDINVLYTEKNYADAPTVGCAFVGTFGDGIDNNSGAYCVNKWLNTSSSLMVLVAHEMGHIFGADHDDANCGGAASIMCSTISTNATAFSNTSVTEIESDLNLETVVENDGRSSIRYRYYPSNTQTTIIAPLAVTTTGNQLVVDGSHSLLFPTGTLTYQATDAAYLRPGFRAVAQPSKVVLIRTGGCDVNGF